LANRSGWLKSRLMQSFERERPIERPLEAISRKLWPWSESRLIRTVGVLAALDFISTYVFLEVSTNSRLVEGGPLAGWALKNGGFFGLFLIDFLSVGSLILLGLAVRALYRKLGFAGLGRTALVFLLVPYLIVILAVIYNNILVSFL
jgi:hypothetical protein